ncbi:MAG: 16S rRNA (cytosine(1402)-N(4))-methyltransferase RsmH [Pseudomonadota bacterium]
MDAEHTHLPVMAAESLGLLALSPGKTAVDATLGGAGHAAQMLKPLSPGGRLIGFDLDEEAVERARERLEAPARELDVALHLFHANYSALGEVLDELAIPKVDALLADLGLSSYQLLDEERGFSFQIDAPLDMRMDATSTLTASELVNRLPEKNLADLIYRYGQERQSRRIARYIVAERARGPLATTARLARAVSRAAYGKKAGGRPRIHPATRTFQALRIAVNDELGSLERLLAQLPRRLAPGGRAVVVSFHSLEDGLVKGFFREQGQRSEDRPALLRVLTTKPLRPLDAEVAANPRSRSARLRAAERLEE